MPICCDAESVWVENVPGKGYHFCKVCRLEVVELVIDKAEKLTKHKGATIGPQDASFWSSILKDRGQFPPSIW